MKQERKKIILYLRPELSEADKFATKKIEESPVQTEAVRTALLAGIALGEIDDRLPSLLASILSERTKADTFKVMLDSFLTVDSDGTHAHNKVNSSQAERGLSTDKVKMEKEPPSQAAQNLKGSLPD
ncbi:plasmid partitioning/stability family protein [Proteus terrae]|uniref:plasmid partitioning/stability family protein n=1 Tax=Proteus terrae TaxID=1574161 RepID=UPI001CC143A3|nr:plasmid partitioning/stability family protein [Proteus terrae]UAX03656.1 plasmid stabilization protein [Proteus terrae subsp. cibarius]